MFKILSVGVCYVLLLLMPALVFAEPSPKDVEAAMKANDLLRAESLVNEVIKNHPNSAKAHYFKAQILEHEHIYLQALGELHEAMRLDPLLKFAASSQKVYEMEARLTMKPTMVPVAPVVPAAPVQSVKPKEPEKPFNWKILLGVMSFFVVVGVFSFIYYRRQKNKEEQIQAEKDDKERARVLASLTDMSETLRVGLLTLKTTDRESAPIYNDVNLLFDEVNKNLKLVKDRQFHPEASTPIAPYFFLTDLELRVTEANNAINNGLKEIPKRVNPVIMPISTVHLGESSQHHFDSNPAPYSSPQVYQSGPGLDFIDGIRLGQILSPQPGHHHEKEPEEKWVDSPSALAAEPEPDYDFGRDSKDSDSGSGGGGWDTGGSSSDSGSSDSGGGGDSGGGDSGW